MLYETIEHEGYKIQVHTMEDPENPRYDQENLGTFLMSHRRYDFGDKDVGYTIGDAGSWEAEEKAIIKQFDTAVILPVYMYDHSGQTVNTTGFRCPWDSGQIGFTWVSKARAKDMFGWKVLTAARLERLREYLVAEIETLDQYLRGEVFGYEVLDPDGDPSQGGCGGFYGTDHDKSGLLYTAKSDIEADIDEKLSLGVQLELAV